jgi:Mrp family chromosome partitioning ATPase
MKNSVKKLPEEIEVEMHNGEKVTLTSPTKTRTYKLIMIVPDDVDMKMVKDAVKKFNQSNKNVVVEIKNSYGHPNRDTEKTSVD